MRMFDNSDEKTLQASQDYAFSGLLSGFWLDSLDNLASSGMTTPKSKPPQR